MHTPTRARIATIAGVVLAVAASLPASAGVIMRATPAHAQPAFMTNPAGRLKRLLAPPPRLHMPLGGRHHMGPLATSYTIDDVGAPAQQSIELEAPAMFNNDGQMVGYEYNTVTNTNNCIAYTGRRWVRINPATFTDCSPMSMSNPNPNTGAFAVVGWGETPNIDGQVGFSATVSRAARFRATTSHDPSEVDAVNSAGTAVGYAFYRPQSGFFETYPPFVLTGSRFRPLQPQCTTQQPLCMADIMTDELTDGCPFGGCAVNDLNVVFGDDYDSDWFYEVMTLGQSGSGQNLPIPWETSLSGRHQRCLSDHLRFECIGSLSGLAVYGRRLATRRARRHPRQHVRKLLSVRAEQHRRNPRLRVRLRQRILRLTGSGIPSTGCRTSTPRSRPIPTAQSRRTA